MRKEAGRLKGREYRGHNSGAGGQKVVATESSNGLAWPVTHHERHSPDGFQWGYGGSGPAELARCMLMDALPRELHDVVERLYQPFKWAFIATAGTTLYVPGSAIEAWLWAQVEDVFGPLHIDQDRRLRRWLEGEQAEEPALG